MAIPPNKTNAQKGRGAVSNLQGRFEKQLREDFDDGWERFEDDTHPELMPVQTHITEELAHSILTRNNSPDLPFKVSLNPYRGCEHGCIYCFARPTHSYLELSPGLDFETRLFAKMNAADLLRRELASQSYRSEPIALGVNADGYQPCERRLQLTRQVLEVMSECRQAVVTITLTTLDHTIARTLEPRATSPTRRLQTIRRLTQAGIPVGVNIAPVIPFITDQDIERILEAPAEAGAISAGYIILRLPWEVSPLFQQWLEAHFPDRAQRVMNRVRDMRGGKDYDSGFGTRMRGEGIWAQLIQQRFNRAVRKLGMADRAGRFTTLDTFRFRKPQHVPQTIKLQDKDSSMQLDMF
jgi:DNA repair photolyase